MPKGYFIIDDGFLAYFANKIFLNIEENRIHFFNEMHQEWFIFDMKNIVSASKELVQVTPGILPMIYG